MAECLSQLRQWTAASIGISVPTTMIKTKSSLRIPTEAVTKEVRNVDNRIHLASLGARTCQSRDNIETSPTAVTRHSWRCFHFSAVTSATDLGGLQTPTFWILMGWYTFGFFVCNISASMSLLMTGMFLGWPSPTVSKLRAGQTPLALTEPQVSWAVSLLYVGSVLSPLAAGRLIDRCGRRDVLRASSVLALVSWVLLACTSDVVSLYVSRILGGMWGGISYCITPVYLCEIAEPRIRGALNTMFTLMIYLGIMFEYCIGPLLSYTTLSLASGCVPLIYVLGMFWIPESPYYFMMKGKVEDAKHALEWLRPGKNVEEELNSIYKSVTADMKNKGRLSDLVNTPGARRALFITEMTAFLQRMSGSSVMMAYISSSVPQNGPVSGDQCAVIMCSIWLVFGVGATLLVDRLGRRPLLALSCTGCAFSTAGLTLWFYLTPRLSPDSESLKIIPFACFAVYALFYPFGLACIPSIIQGELFPANVKGRASGITAVVVASVSFINNKLYQPIGDSWGMYANYLYFTVSSTYGVYFALNVMLETRNKTLQEIHVELVQLHCVDSGEDSSNNDGK